MSLSSTNSGIKIMECLYVMLESGCIITRLLIIGKRITIGFTMNDSAWTIMSSGRINNICEQIKSFNIISDRDWHHHTSQFYCRHAARNSFDFDSNDNIATTNTTNTNHATPEIDPPTTNTNITNNTNPTTHNKNVAIMTFILNAMVSGWRVRKSFSRGGEYRFNKDHLGKRKYLNAKFLSRFLERNIQL